MAKPAGLPRRLVLPSDHSDAPVLVALSGGADSTALLHLAATSGLQAPSAIHVHHGLQAAADDWAARCQALCNRLGVPLRIARVRIDPADPAGPEAAARAARYAAFAEALPAGGLLLTAHHRGDQAETVLLRLLRGSGVEGLGAIRPLTPFAQGSLWRPLLDCPGETLREYARAQGLDWVEDPHNRNPRYARSWLRGALLPRLRERWPEAEAQLAATARRCDEAAGLLHELAAELLPSLLQPEGGLSIAGLQALSAARRRLVLRHWIEQLRLPTPYDGTLQRLDAEVLDARPDTEPCLRWPGGEFRRYRQSLYAMAPLPPVPAGFDVAWDGRAPLTLPSGCGLLLPGAAIDARVRLPRGGERLRPEGEVHHRSLRALAQREGVPPWIRERLALIEVDDRLLSVAGRWTTDRAQLGAARQCWPDADPPGLPLSWRRNEL